MKNPGVVDMLMLGLLLLFLCPRSSAQDGASEARTRPDISLPEPVRGQLISTGSVTMAELMYAFARALDRRHPGISMQVHASGSATAPPALTEGTANIGAMSRRMSDDELTRFRQRHGHDLTMRMVAHDAIVMIVNLRNPLPDISLAQIAQLFSASAACPQNFGLSTPQRWSELAPQEPAQPSVFGRRSIQRFSRNTASGTYSWFRENALCGAAMTAAVHHMLSHTAIVNAVQQADNGIGYIGYAHSGFGTRTLPIRTGNQDEQRILANADNITDGSYPLSRQLYLYLNLPPDNPDSAAVQALMQLIYSPAGEQIILRAGLLPLSAEQQQQQLQGIIE